MPLFPTTDAKLIAAIADGEHQQAWYEFERLYSPALKNVLRKQGLSSFDAEDCCQRILSKLVQVVAKFENDGHRAAFRRWLYRVARNETVSFLRQQNRFPISLSDSNLRLTVEHTQSAGRSASAPSVHPWELEQSIEAEYRKHAFLAAAEQVRANVNPKHWLAFWRTMVEPEPTHAVAKELGLSVGAIYVAKGRILKLLQAAVKDWEES